MRACLSLAFKATDGGRSILDRVDQEPPWKVIRGFSAPGGVCLVHLNNVSGGLLGGDELTLDVAVQAAAKVQLTSTGATRIYRGDTVSKVSTRISLAENSVLEYLPDALIPFAGSALDQTTVIEMSSGSSLFWWEVVAPGREAGGELFQYRSLRLRSELNVAGVPFALDNMQLQPERAPLDSPARMGSARYVATMYIAKVGEPAERWRQVQEGLAPIASRRTGNDEVRWGVSTLTNHGIVVRGLCRGLPCIWPGLHEFWSAAKLLLLGQEATRPRKIY